MKPILIAVFLLTLGVFAPLRAEDQAKTIEDAQAQAGGALDQTRKERAAIQQEKKEEMKPWGKHGFREEQLSELPRVIGASQAVEGVLESLRVRTVTPCKAYDRHFENHGGQIGWVEVRDACLTHGPSYQERRELIAEPKEILALVDNETNQVLSYEAYYWVVWKRLLWHERFLLRLSFAVDGEHIATNHELALGEWVRDGYAK